MKMKNEFTQRELEMMDYCLLRRQITLEEANLKDGDCYPIILSIRNKLKKYLHSTKSVI